ncbi:MAG: hypothetical protein RR678_11395 [Lachnospiraceae bacterium]
MFFIKLFQGNITYGIYGLLFKVLFVLICFSIIYFLVKKKNVLALCKTCKTRIGAHDTICKKCGMELTDDNKEIIVGKSSKRIIVLCISIPIILVFIIVSTILVLSKSNNFFYELSGSTGIYLERSESSNAQHTNWSVDCQALTEGQLKKVINQNHVDLKELKVINNTTEGNLKLKIEQNNLSEIIEIENETNEQIFDLSKYTDDEIRLTVLHEKSDHIDFQFSWD